MTQAQNYSRCKSIKHLEVAPSAKLENRKAVKSETQIVWNCQESEVRSLPWVRESFSQAYGRKPHEVGSWLAYSINDKGQKIRHWWHRKTDFSDYAELGTCPLEAVFPLSIELGEPSLPALPYCTQLEP